MKKKESNFRKHFSDDIKCDKSSDETEHETAAKHDPIIYRSWLKNIFESEDKRVSISCGKFYNSKNFIQRVKKFSQSLNASLNEFKKVSPNSTHSHTQ